MTTLIACGVAESGEIVVVDLREDGSLLVSVEVEGGVREMTLPARAVADDLRVLVSQREAAA